MKVNFVSLGCPKNLVDSEKILGALGASGVMITTSAQDSDIIIINTCGFIKPAMHETEEEISKALRCAQTKGQKVYVYGCAVNHAEAELRKKFPAVSAWFTIDQKPALLRVINAAATQIESRLVTTKGYAYLKIADGCSNHCSYCTIPTIKGSYQSFELDSLVKEAIELTKLGIREIILIAQDTTGYGLDNYEKPMLVLLIRKLANIPGLKWIRVMYAHPKTITDEIIDEIASNEKVCNYLDMPIQHINNRILELMNRGVNKSNIIKTIKKVQDIKQISLRTTVMVGFPTETADEFKELLGFLKTVRFDWLGVFPYSCEPGTKAALLDQLPQSIINQRYAEIIKLQQDTIHEHNVGRIGNIYKTLIHQQNRYFIGHTEFAAPDIDGQIITANKGLNVGEFYNLRMDKIQGADLYGYTEDTD